MLVNHSFLMKPEVNISQIVLLKNPVKLTTMDEFLLLMRLDITTKEAQPSPEQMQEYMKQYQEWIANITAQKKFVGGKGLSFEGKVVKNNIVTDGPYAETKESLAGFIIIQANDFNEALTFAKACPILGGDGNSVEVRKVMGVENGA